MPTYGFGNTKVVDVNTGSFFKTVGMLLLALFLIIMLWASVAKVDAGNVGVLTLFGRVTGEVLPEGIHMVNPFKINHQMTIRTQEQKESATVPSSEGLVVGLDTSLIFHLNPERAADVYQKIGPDKTIDSSARNYVDVLVEPTLRSAIRSATSAHSANALYSGSREEVATQIQTELERELAPRGFVIEKVLLRDITMPPALKQAIEAKQQAEQESLAMSFRLQKEKQEADRKRIEAAGIRDFQQIVAQGISPALLEWKGIEATEKLADSQNTKIVVIGNPKNGLPLILGQQ